MEYIAVYIPYSMVFREVLEVYATYYKCLSVVIVSVLVNYSSHQHANLVQVNMKMVLMR